jgi:putative transposase
MAISVPGGLTALGSRSMTAYRQMSEKRKGDLRNLLPPFSILRRSKRHILVDTIGLVLLAVVHSAAIQDRDSARLVLAPLAHAFTKLRKIWADSIYAGALVEWVRSSRRHNRIDLEIVKRSDEEKGFVVLPRCWVVERTFAWLSFNRRLSKDYEYLPVTSETFIYISMIRLMLARVA